VHPLVLELTGKQEPRTGLEGKFSVFHGCAAVLVFGRAAEAEFHEAIVQRPDVVALRRRIHATVDPSIAHEAAHVEIDCHDGRRLVQQVEHASGSLQRPMTDRALDDKFDALAVPVLGAARAAAVRRHCRALGAGDGELKALFVQAVPG